MPTSYIKKLVEQGKGSEAELESKWERAIDIAAEEGHAEDYAYITGIFKKMTKVSALDFMRLIKKALLDAQAPQAPVQGANSATGPISDNYRTGAMTSTTAERPAVVTQTMNQAPQRAPKVLSPELIKNDSKPFEMPKPEKPKKQTTKSVPNTTTREELQVSGRLVE